MSNPQIGPITVNTVTENVPNATGQPSQPSTNGVQAQTQTINNGERDKNSPFFNAKPISYFMQEFLTSGHLTTGAKNYIDSLRAYLDSKLHNNSFSITTLNAMCGVEAIAVVNNSSKYGVILLFDDSNDYINDTPTAAKTRAVLEVAQAADPTAKFMESIVVVPEDYSKVEIMGDFISNACRMMITSNDEYNAGSFKGFKLVASSNMDFVRKFIADKSPHAIPARDDIGIIVSSIEHSRDMITGKDNEKMTPIVAITGYTKFYVGQDGRYVPVVTVSDIVSAIPHRSILGMAIPVAITAFCRIGTWQRPYKDLTEGKPNIGALAVDPTTGMSGRITTIQEFDKYLAVNIAPPVFAIDISEGRARIPSIDKLMTRDCGSLIDSVADFMMLPDYIKQYKPVSKFNCTVMNNYTGHYEEKGIKRDTRNVDYLNIATQVKDVRPYFHFVEQNYDEMFNFRAIKSIFQKDTTRAIYRTSTVVLPTEVANFLITALEHTDSFNPTYDLAQPGVVDVTKFFMPNAWNYGSFIPVVNNGYNQNVYCGYQF